MSVREVLKRISSGVNYNAPRLVEQTEAVDMDRIEKRIEAMANRAIVLAHAFDVMRDKSHPHPMDAFLHAYECQGTDEMQKDDEEFCKLLDVWARLCRESATPLELIQGTEFKGR